MEITYVAADRSAGQKLAEGFPALTDTSLGALTIARFVPEEVGRLDLLFVSLPRGVSRALLARLPPSIKVVDVGGVTASRKAGPMG